jgi:hypothetical protein
LKLGIEADGEMWHSSEEKKADDQERDYLLAQRGWTILRFNDKVIDEAPQAVQETINTYIEKLSHHRAKTGSSEIHLFITRKGDLVDLEGDYNKYSEIYKEANFSTSIGQEEQ